MIRKQSAGLIASVSAPAITSRAHAGSIVANDRVEKEFSLLAGCVINHNRDAI